MLAKCQLARIHSLNTRVTNDLKLLLLILMFVEELKWSCSRKQNSLYQNLKRDPPAVTGEQPLTTGAQTDLPNFSTVVHLCSTG